MCGRLSQNLTWQQIYTLYTLPVSTPRLDSQPRYNGAPTQDFALCRLGENGIRTMAVLRWGLVPFWAKDVKIGARLINARAETVHEKPAFRSALRARRCLIPSNGWFEWKRTGGGKQPYFLALESGAPVSFAALWEQWGRDGQHIESFTIITTEASPGLTDIHNRQPRGSRSGRLHRLARSRHTPGNTAGNHRAALRRSVRNPSCQRHGKPRGQRHPGYPDTSGEEYALLISRRTRGPSHGKTVSRITARP